MSCLRARTREARAVQPAGPASDTFEPALVAGRIDGLLRGLVRPATGLCVAYSGGLDSTVLLHALAMLPDPASRPRLRAVHVDHGLNPQSPRWSHHCASVAAALAIDCRRLTVDARAPRGASPEAWARTARRAAIAAELAAGEVLLTAHHADDQLETVLLQLLRGGGPAGIAGMPRLAPFGRGWQARPLLDFTRDSLHRWAIATGLHWVEDPTNLELRFDRNYLRHSVLSAVRARWPQAARTVGQVAILTAETVQLAAVLAESDLARVREGLTLPIAALAALPEPRQRAVLRAWLAGQDLPLPSVGALLALRRDLWRAADDRVPCARWQDVRVYRYRGRLYAERARPPPVAERLHLSGDGVALPVGGRLELRATNGRGLSRVRLPAQLELRPRRGGESFHPMQREHRRPLRKWLQERGVLPWLRDHVPLLYAGEELVCIADLACGAEYAAREGEDSWEVCWRDRPVLTEAEALRSTWTDEERAR
jgi:tRNA(Ile)-lysidine synthase